MFNRVMLIGNLGKDPEVKYTQSQLAICNFSLATTEKRKNSDGKYEDATEWHNVVVFGKTAENCAQYLAKGKKAYVEGSLRTRKWQDKEGKDRYTTEITASNVIFLSPKNEEHRHRDDDEDEAPPVKGSIGAIQQDFDDSDLPF